jgi:cytosine/adenosine deaminase-related metal-dependent hydrolase
VLAAGEPADILLLDCQKLDDERLRADIDPMDLLFARATARHIHELIVAGRTVVRDGEILGVDFASLRDELLAQVRSGIAASTALVSALGELDHAVAAYFAQAAPCC